LACRMGSIGIWTNALDRQPSALARTTAVELEQMGFGALWVPEAVRREPFVNAALLLSATSSLVLATGIANIWARDATATNAAMNTLAEAYPGRFVLGVGVGNGPQVLNRGHDYHHPLEYMRSYFAQMDGALFEAPPPVERPIRLVAALGPKMLELAASAADGAHPYLVTPNHTSRAREILGPERWLVPEQGVIFDSNAERARSVARQHLAPYLSWPNYSRNFLRLGFKQEDLEDGGSNDLVDGLVAWGELDSVLMRVQAHLTAGANHVAVQVLTATPEKLPIGQWRELALALGQ
jgi:probable F420-dependent oxidoreductase